MNSTPLRITPSDPLFSLQWHLLNNGTLPGSRAGQDINVTKVWPDYTGRGILVGVMDDGVDLTHPDLLQSLRPDLSWDLVLNQPGGNVTDPSDEHGTAVAGLVAATANNGLGGVGVAWDAEVLSNRTPLRDEDLLLSYQRAVDRMLVTNVDISTNSWGPMQWPFDQQATQSGYQAATFKLVEEGRGGLGIITLFAAGNDRDAKFNANYDPSDNMPWTIVVAAGNIDGTISSYSTPGASVLVTAPGSDPASIVTTDRQGELGYNKAPGVEGNYTDTVESAFNGTSAATPIAAGAVALMLDANARLGYRDVQEILVYSSQRAVILDQVAADKSFNGSKDWNGGALLTSQDFGYGHIDTHAAVRLAESWTKLGTVANQRLEQGVVAQSAVTVGAGQTGQVVASFAQPYRVEQMSVTLKLATTTLQNVTVELVSPNGTVSTLVDQPPVYVPEPGEEEPFPALPATLDYTFNTVRNWGEDLSGSWTLRITNEAGGDAVQLNDWSIMAHAASQAVGGGTQIFTNDFARFAAEQPGRVTLNAENGQSINAAAMTSDTVINLESSQATLGGVGVTVADPAAFRNLFSGDGNDTLIGNAGANLLMAGRGSNTIDGKAGFDVVRFIGDRSAYSVSKDGDLVVVNSLTLSGGGMDQIRNAEVLHFADQAVLVNAPQAQGAQLFDEAAYLRANPDVAQAVQSGVLTSAYQHYQQWGANEGRDPNDMFDEAWYLAYNTDVAAAVRSGQLTNGYQHYQSYGWAENRSPSAWMDAGAYKLANPDVAQAGMDPMAHYLMFGYSEGRALPSWSADLWV